MKNITTVILAAGKSTRFKSKKSKLTQELAGLPVVSHVYNTAKKISGKNVKIKIDESRLRPYDVNRLICNNKKARKILDWKPKITTETKFHLKVNNKRANEISIKEFSSKKSSYIKFINETIDNIHSSELEKVVCSSIFNVKLNSNSSIEYFKKLLQLNHDAFCYLFYHPEIGVWIGASPEKLIDLNNKIITTFALAATKKDINQSWTDKEFREHLAASDIVVNLRYPSMGETSATLLLAMLHSKPCLRSYQDSVYCMQVNL